MASAGMMTCCQVTIFALLLVFQPVFTKTEKEVMSARVEVFVCVVIVFARFVLHPRNELVFYGKQLCAERVTADDSFVLINFFLRHLFALP